MPKIAFLDTETTGLFAEDQRIIEIAILTYDSGSRKLVDSYVQRIDPERAIEAKAQAVHGISYESLAGEPKMKDVANTISTKIDATALVVAHNAAFDVPFIGMELHRVGAPLPSVPSFCTCENGRWATPDGKLPNLRELCFALGVDYDPSKAHGAEYDVQVMAECFFRGVDRGFFVPTYREAA